MVTEVLSSNFFGTFIVQNILGRFQKWFQPHGSQSAYQSLDHVFMLRALINHCLFSNDKLFVMYLHRMGHCLFKVMHRY